MDDVPLSFTKADGTVVNINVSTGAGIEEIYYRDLRQSSRLLMSTGSIVIAENPNLFSHTKPIGQSITMRWNCTLWTQQRS